MKQARIFFCPTPDAVPIESDQEMHPSYPPKCVMRVNQAVAVARIIKAGREEFRPQTDGMGGSSPKVYPLIVLAMDTPGHVVWAYPTPAERDRDWRRLMGLGA